MTIDVDKKLSEVSDAAISLRCLSTKTKNKALALLRQYLMSPEHRDVILAANEKDLKALPRGVSVAFRDRLMLTPERLRLMGESLKDVEALPDPVGEVVSQSRLKSGLHARRVRAPLGVIFMIFESRPNVAIEAFSVAFKAGNAIILRGGRESRHSCGVLYDFMTRTLKEVGVPPACLWGITDPNRILVKKLLAARSKIDVVIPRGGESLIEYVCDNTAIPVIKNDRGLCHVYVHESADLRMAQSVAVNAKTSRPGVCNAMETLLVDESVAGVFLPSVFEALSAKGVHVRACARSLKILGKQKLLKKATSKDFHTEYLELIMNLKVVSGFAEALHHIERHGSRHSECIVTGDSVMARRFQAEVDAAAVYWNASTRFTDGFEMGLGGELGISTQKLHTRGPVGVTELTTPRWILDGAGQIRG